MEPNLRVLFDRALDDEPGPPPGDLVREAMAQGRGIRQRRRLVIGGSAVAVVVAVLIGLNVAVPAESPPPVLTPAGMMARAEPQCTWGVRARPAGVVVLLTADVTAAQRADLRAGLHTDPLVRDLRFEDRQQAYARLIKLWRKDPDLKDTEFATGVLRESFRLTLADPERFADFAGRFQGRAGVEELVGVTCPGPAK